MSGEDYEGMREWKRQRKNRSISEAKKKLKGANVPYQETATPNVVSISINGGLVYASLITFRKLDSGYKYIKIRVDGKRKWQHMRFQYFINRCVTALNKTS